MEIKVIKAVSTGPTVLEISHGGKSTLWDVVSYSKSSDRRSPMDTELIFKEINEYWATLSQKEQTQYWDIFQKAREALDTQLNHSVLSKTLTELCSKLYELVDLEKLQHWVVFRSGIKIPSDLKESFEDLSSDGISYPHRREKTYLRHEYIELVVLTVALRMMVPIWGEFIKTARKDIGATSKEIEAFRLLFESKLHTVPAMLRLQEYIHTTVSALQGADVNAASILNGMGLVEFSDWITALTVVRRLSMCQISASDTDNSNLVTNVYQYVKLNVRGSYKKHSKKFGGKVTLRKLTDIGDDKQNKTVAEVYKIKQEVPDGIKVLMQTYFKRPDVVLLRLLGYLEPGQVEPVKPIPDDLIQKLQLCLQWISHIEEFELYPHQITLAQWVLSPILSPKAIHLLTYDALLSAIAVTQAALWERGFFDLAALMTARAFENEEDVMVGASETRGRIPKELMEDLLKYWPHTQPSKSRQGFRSSNVAARAIDTLCEQLSQCDWILYCPHELLQPLSGRAVGRRMSIPSDIRWTLSQLLIAIATATGEQKTS